MSTILNRKRLGRKTFWKRLREEASAGRAIQIHTDDSDPRKLPWDVRLLLKRAQEQKRLNTVAVNLAAILTPDQIIIITLTLIIALVGVTIIFVVKRYKFTIRVSPDGAIEIDGEPTAVSTAPAM